MFQNILTTTCTTLQKLKTAIKDRRPMMSKRGIFMHDNAHRNMDIVCEDLLPRA